MERNCAIHLRAAKYVCMNHVTAETDLCIICLKKHVKLCRGSILPQEDFKVTMIDKNLKADTLLHNHLEELNQSVRKKFTELYPHFEDGMKKNTNFTGYLDEDLV